MKKYIRGLLLITIIASITAFSGCGDTAQSFWDNKMGICPPGNACMPAFLEDQGVGSKWLACFDADPSNCPTGCKVVTRQEAHDLLINQWVHGGGISGLTQEDIDKMAQFYREECEPEESPTPDQSPTPNPSQ